MKKLLISFMLCCGVGLTMMGSPAQASDDNNQNNTVVTNCESISSTNGSVAVAPEQPNKPMHHGHLGLKHECNKRIDVSSKRYAPKRMHRIDSSIVVIGKIKKEPFPPKPGPVIIVNGPTGPDPRPHYDR